MKKCRILERFISPVLCLVDVYFNVELYIKLKGYDLQYMSQTSLGSNLSSLCVPLGKSDDL